MKTATSALTASGVAARESTVKCVNRIIGLDYVFRLYFRKRKHPAGGAAITSLWPEVLDGSDLWHEIQTLLNIGTVKPKVSNLAGALGRYEA